MIEIEKIVIMKLVEEPQISEILKPEYFEIPIARYIFKRIKERFQSDAKFFNPALISTEIATKDFTFVSIFEYTGGGTITPIESAEYYATILKEKYFKKDIKELLIDFYKRADEPNSNFFDIFKKIEEKKEKLESTIEIKNNNLQENLNDAVKEMYVRIEKYKKGATNYQSNFKEVDNIVTPEKGNIMTIAARPSVGKTSLVNNFAKNYAKNGGDFSGHRALKPCF